MDSFKKSLLLFLTIPIISSCSVNSARSVEKPNYSDNNYEIEQIVKKQEISKYNDILKTSRIKEISITDLKTPPRKNNVSKIVYFGKPSCGLCRKVIIQNEIGLKKSSLELYYINTSSLDQQEQLELTKLNISAVPSFIEIHANTNFQNMSIETFERIVNDEQT